MGTKKIRLRNPVRLLFGESQLTTWSVILLVIIVGMLLIRPVAKSIMSWHRTAGLLTERRDEVSALKLRNEQLTKLVSYYQTDQFIAEQARTYGMIVPGERSFVVRELVHPESAAQFAISRLRNATVDHDIALVSS